MEARVHMGLYWYILQGDCAEEAASELEKRIDCLYNTPGVRYFLDDLESIRTSVSDVYHVKIKTNLD